MNGIMNRVKMVVGTQIWLVPEYLGGLEFLDAVKKFNETPSGNVVEWTESEAKAFELVRRHHDVYRPM